MKTSTKWTGEGFFDLVHEMRLRQKHYFATRSPAALREAKNSEKAVDNYLDYHLNKLAGKPHQGDLYE
jgi:hypothetical protein